MAYVIGVITPEGLREIWADSLEEHRKNLEIVNRNKWRIKYSASGKFAKENNEFLQKARLKSLFGKDYEQQFTEPVYIEAGKEVTVSSGVAEKLGLISKEEAEKNKDTIYVVRSNIDDVNKTKVEKADIPKINISLESTLPKSTSGTATTSTISAYIPEEPDISKEKLTNEFLKNDKSFTGIVSREIATKTTTSDPFGLKTIFTTIKGFITGKKKEEIAQDIYEIKKESAFELIEWTTVKKEKQKYVETFKVNDIEIITETPFYEREVKNFFDVQKTFIFKSETGKLAQTIGSGYLLGSTLTTAAPILSKGGKISEVGFNIVGSGLVVGSVYNVGGKLYGKNDVTDISTIIAKEAIGFTGFMSGFSEGFKTGEPFRTIEFFGKKYYPPEQITGKDVIKFQETGKGLKFPYRHETPSQLVKRFYVEKYTIQDSGKKILPSGFHVTTANIKSGSKIMLGTSETYGLYVSPEASLHFARIYQGKTKYKPSDFFDFSDLLRGGTPKAIEVKVSGATRLPKNVRYSYSKANEFMITKAQKTEPKIYITPAFERGKPESEGVVPPNFILEFKGYKGYTKVGKSKIGLIEAVVKKPSDVNIGKISNLKISSSDDVVSSGYSGVWFRSILEYMKPSKSGKNVNYDKIYVSNSRTLYENKYILKETVKPSSSGLYSNTFVFKPSKIEYVKQSLLTNEKEIFKIDKITFVKKTEIYNPKTTQTTLNPQKLLDFSSYNKKMNNIKYTLTRQKTKYKPSLVGIIFNIKSKKKGVLTGFEIRGLE